MSAIPEVPLLMLIGHRRPTTAARMGALSFVLLAVAVAAPGPASATSAVSTFPIPGSRVASPYSQIAFRGIPARLLTGISVRGSRSGAHSGVVRADSDGAGGSFLPTKAFSAGETVTVRTALNIRGANGGVFHFRVADPTRSIPYRPAPRVPVARGETLKFHSRPDLRAAAISLARRGGSGDIFVAPQEGPSRNGPEIFDRNGHLVWFKPAPANTSVTDFRVQRYQGRPVLTWWQGNINGGTGRGRDLIYDTNYRQIAVVRAANGLSADLHEFNITGSNTALITAYYPVYWDARSVHRPAHQIVLDAVVQEIDIPTGLVLFQWDSLDHVALTDSYVPPPPIRTRNPFDYFHVNSAERDHDGNIVISARNTWAAYKVDHLTGRTIWTLGGRHSTFKMGPGAAFAFQHDVRIRSGHDWYVTLFDDGGGPPAVHKQSRALKLFLDVKHRTARVVNQWEHSPPVSAFFEGNDQQLANFDDFVGWGGQPYFTEYDRHGKVVLDGRFVGPNSSYRAYRFQWRGTSPHLPAIAAARHGNRIRVYASWNGTTDVWSWRVLGGASTTSLRPIASSRTHGLETEIDTGAQRYVAVEPLDRSGRVMSRSATIIPR